MKNIIVHIPNDAMGKRLDQWVASNTTYSRSGFKQMVDKKCVFLNNQLIKKAGYKVSEAGILEIKNAVKEYEPIAMDLDIVYEDDYLLVVNKPRNLLVYPVKDQFEPTLVNGLLAYTTLSDFCGKERPGLVHRIDRDTSGLVLVAKTNAVHEKLYNMLSNHDIIREYIGIVQKPLDKKSGTINKAIAQDYSHGIKRVIVPHGGQKAITHYTCVYQNDSYALMKFRLETGRTHQIRVHMASIGHPLVGDGLYGCEKNIFGFQGQALHAVRLVFTHPVTGEEVVAYGRPPEIFKKAVKRIKMME